MSRPNPTHPGDTIREDCIATLGWTVPEAADFLHVDVRQLTAIIECREPVTLNVARRLSLVFGSTTDMWLRMQARHDRAHSHIGSSHRQIGKRQRSRLSVD